MEESYIVQELKSSLRMKHKDFIDAAFGPTTRKEEIIPPNSRYYRTMGTQMKNDHVVRVS